jgi:hypothetical protein
MVSSGCQRKSRMIKDVVVPKRRSGQSAGHVGMNGARPGSKAARVVIVCHVGVKS